LPLILNTERDPMGGGVQGEPRCSDRCSGSRSIVQKNLIPTGRRGPPYTPRFNIRQLTDVLHCKLQQQFRRNRHEHGS
jgi:hypothetical protein